MIALLKTEKSLPLDHIYRLAEASKKLREQRNGWKDKWDFNRLASTHDEQVASHSGEYADYDKALDLVVQWVDPIPGELGLDIGTGTGNLAGRFMDRGISMSAVDQSKEMLRLCRRKHPALDTRLGNLLALPYLEGQFDLVVSSFAFHHLTYDQQLLALEEIRRVIKPHGRICIADLMDSNDHSHENAEQYTSAQTLIKWFEKNGYSTKFEQMNPLLHIVYAAPKYK